MPENVSRDAGVSRDGTLCDTAAMFVVHAFVRAQFSASVGWVGGVRDGDLRHAGAVADHLDFLIGALHTHHEGEDAMLWDELTERAPACALHVARMRAQHAELSVRLDALGAALPAWRARADGDAREGVLIALDAVRESIGAHLPDEETSILPTVAATITQREWDRIGDHARRRVPHGWTWIQLGAMRDALGETEGDEWMRRELPAPVVLLWRLVGRRTYARHLAQLAGER